MKNIIKFLKWLFIIISMLFISMSAFGGGALYWLIFCAIFKIEGTVAEIGCVISLAVFSFIGFTLAPKFSDKYL